MQRFLSFVIVFFFLLVSLVWGQIPQTMSYQGVLTDTSGQAIADGNYQLIFKLYDSATEGSELWSESQSVVIINGIFNVILGSINPLTLPFDSPYWLGVTIGAGRELTPRIELTASAYSLNARSIADSIVTGEKIANGHVVRSINSLTDTVVLAAGDNVSITQTADTLRISATAAAGGNTLDQAYDQGGEGAGRTITADAGAVNIAGPDGLIIEGSVGIGTTTPQSTLEVSGIVHSSTGGFKFPDGSLQTTAFSGVADAWKLTGNSGTNETDNFIGTTDKISLNFRVNNRRALKLVPNGISPNLIGGYEYNRAKSGVNGGVIGGGGYSGKENLIADHYGTVSGGSDNQAGSDDQDRTNSEYATVGGGLNNTASGGYATIPGGRLNTASGDYSFAAGYKAKANHSGSFVWSDKSGEDFSSSSDNQFLIRANGGVGIGTNAPSQALDVEGNIHASGTISSGGSITIDGTNNTITSSSGKIDFDNENLVTSGKVGIGKNNPNAPLDVNGEVKADSVSTTNLNVSGAYKGNIGPNGGAPFPRPAYDSGWVSMNQSQTIRLTHNIGGNVDNYVVDLQFDGPFGRTNKFLGGFYYNGGYLGAFYFSLNNQSVLVQRFFNDPIAYKIRIRIWVYN